MLIGVKIQFSSCSHVSNTISFPLICVTMKLQSCQLTLRKDTEAAVGPGERTKRRDESDSSSTSTSSSHQPFSVFCLNRKHTNIFTVHLNMYSKKKKKEKKVFLVQEQEIWSHEEWRKV